MASIRRSNSSDSLLSFDDSVTPTVLTVDLISVDDDCDDDEYDDYSTGMDCCSDSFLSFHSAMQLSHTSPIPSNGIGICDVLSSFNFYAPPSPPPVIPPHFCADGPQKIFDVPTSLTFLRQQTQVPAPTNSEYNSKCGSDSDSHSDTNSDSDSNSDSGSNSHSNFNPDSESESEPEDYRPSQYLSHALNHDQNNFSPLAYLRESDRNSECIASCPSFVELGSSVDFSQSTYDDSEFRLLQTEKMTSNGSRTLSGASLSSNLSLSPSEESLPTANFSKQYSMPTNKQYSTSSSRNHPSYLLYNPSSESPSSNSSLASLCLSLAASLDSICRSLSLRKDHAILNPSFASHDASSISHESSKVPLTSIHCSSTASSMTSITTPFVERPSHNKITPPSQIQQVKKEYDHQKRSQPPSECMIHSDKCNIVTGSNYDDGGLSISSDLCVPNYIHNDRIGATAKIIWTVARETICFNLVLCMFYLLFILYRDLLFDPIEMIRKMSDNAVRFER